MDFPLGPPVQIAYAVRATDDLHRAAEDFRRRTGAGPFVHAEHIGIASAEIRGRNGVFDHSSAYGQWGDLMVELIQEHTPPLIESTTGIHHVAFMVESLDRGVEACIGLDWPPILDATTTGGQRFVFCDARRELGHLVEMYEPSPTLVAFYDYVRSIRA